MSIEIYHQLGFRHQWNFESYSKDNVGDGFILASSYMEIDELAALSIEKKRVSIFDPQFFMPNVRKRSLSTYHFFPDVVAEGFQTTEYPVVDSVESAEKCILFQLENGFSKIVIPTRYISGMPSEFIPQQEQLFVRPFIDAISKIGKDRPILLQLIVNNGMINDQNFSSDILNWITGIQEIDGVYLIADVSPRAKQITDIDFLYNYLHFINVLSNNDLYTLLGYLNTEAALLTLASPSAVTIGSYENLRMFNIRNFRDDYEGPKHGPNARIYTSRLFQWIDTRYVGAINRVMGNNDLFDDNHYKAIMFQPVYRWHFSKPELYKHSFLVFSNQLKSITSYNGRDRYLALSDQIKDAMGVFDNLGKTEVVLDSDSSGQHLPMWLTAANMFARDQGWR